MRKILRSKVYRYQCLMVLVGAIAIVVTIFAIKYSQDTRSKAANAKLQYKKAEVVVKLKNNLSLKKERQGSLDFDKNAVSLSDLDPTAIPNSLKKVSEKYSIKRIEKVLKETSDPKTELAKTKARFATELSNGTRTLDEQKLLQTDLSKIYKITFNNDPPVDQIVSILISDPSVERAEPNYVYTVSQAQSIPDDTYFSSQWALNNTGQTAGKVDADIDAPEAWSITKGSPLIIVAVIDTGIDYKHPDLGGCIGPKCKVIGGYDFLNNDADPMDDDGHGTHVAGIIGATSGNNMGIAGICPNCKILAIKFIGPNGGYLDGALASIQYAVYHGAKVINNSWGGVSGGSSSLLELVDWSVANGSVFVAAAGNEDSEQLVYPASYTNALSVAAISNKDVKASYSSYGTWVDISAPGGEWDYTKLCIYPKESTILSTMSLGHYWTERGPLCGITQGNAKYMGLLGTSMAAPHVSGVAGLVLSRFSNLNPSQVVAKILSSTDFIDTLNPPYKGKLGKGRLNAYKAVLGPSPVPPVNCSAPPPLCSNSSTCAVWCNTCRGTTGYCTPGAAVRHCACNTGPE